MSELTPKREVLKLQRDTAKIKRICREIEERKRDEEAESEMTHHEWLKKHHSREARH